MAGERAVLMFTDPPYLVDYDGGNHPQTWGKDGRAITSEEKTRHWDAYTDPQTATAFFEGFLRVAIEEALVPERRALPVLRRDARRPGATPPGAPPACCRTRR